MSDDDPPEHIDRPVLIVPGIVGTLGAGEFMEEWFVTRGIEPERPGSDDEDDSEYEQVIEVDPVGGYYYDVIASLENVGYELDESLFVVTYDWRLPVGPYPDSSDDFDGTVDVGGAKELVDDEEFRYGVDYLGYYLKKAAESWEEEFDDRPDSVDVITHSTGGLVTRVYLQSNAYRDAYDDESGARLPAIHDFAMIGVPNRGSSKAWNALQNNFAGSEAYRAVISKIAYQAYFMLKTGAADEITGHRNDITLEDVQDDDGETDFATFIELYTPTIQDLLATYPFLIEDPFDPEDPVDINDHDDEEIVRLRNDALLNLNDGLDYDATIEDVFTDSGELSGRTDPSRFVEKLTDDGHAVVIVAADVDTVTYVHRRRHFARLDFPPQAGMEEFLGTYPLPGERWYEDLYPSDIPQSETDDPRNGDGTVPLESSCKHYIADARFHDDGGSIHCIAPGALAASSPLAGESAVHLHEDDNEVKNIGHTGLPGNPIAQRIILERLVGEENVSESDISTGKALLLTDYHDRWGTFANVSTAVITLLTRGIYDHAPYLLEEEFGLDVVGEITRFSRWVFQKLGPVGEKSVDFGEYVAETGSDLAKWLEEELGIVFVAYHGDIRNRPGLGAVLTENFEGSDTHTFGNGWRFGWSTTGEFTLELLLQPAPEFSRSLSMRLRWHEDDEADEDPSEDASATTELAFEPAEADEHDEELVLFGDPETTRLAVRSAGLRTGGRYEQGSEIDEPVGIPLVDVESDDLLGEGTVFFEIPVTARLVVEQEGFGEFVAEMLGDEDVDTEFEVTVGWSTDSGFYLGVSGDLELSIPLDRSLGSIDLERIDLNAIPNPGEDVPPPEFGLPGPDVRRLADELNRTAEEIEDQIETELRPRDRDPVKRDEQALHGWLAVSGSVEIGPLTGTITGVGLEGRISVRSGGAVWPPTLELGIKPPEGIGIGLDAGAVDGGGFLDYDPHNERYAGIVKLSFGEITLNAVGLLSTDVPGDQAAYSLLVIIAGEFPPIRLGLGFTLTGVGGIVGLHRSIKAEPLGQTIRDGALDSVLFPEDPVANADRILSDLRRIFPVTPDTHAFGPIVRIEWGEPTVLTADLGVVLELPSWKIAVLGDIRVVLPDPEKELVTLNMAASGVIDPDEDRIDVDATLYDSQLGNWTLTGDMALRTRRGDDPRFVLSVGGFNPRYDPPSDVPSLERMTATLGPSSGNPTLEFAGYVAITSNTFQAGASVDAVAKAGPALVEGTVSFDSLIEFDPFGFVADFHASFSVTVKGSGFSVTVDGTISGPGPFRIQGKIEISLFLFSISASLDVKLGSGVTAELPTARIMPELEAELARAGNWEAQLPEFGDGFAVLRDVDRDAESVIAHPLAEIGVRQTVVPLGFEIEKFGEATPSEYTHFELAGATIEGAALDLSAETEEHFAPAQYLKLSDAERLDSSAFETHPAGRKLRDRGVYLGYDDEDAREANLRETTLEYSCVVFDRASEREGAPLGSLGGFTDSLSGFGTGVVSSLEDVGAVAQSPIRRAGSRRFRLSENDKLEDRALTDGKTASLRTDDGQEDVRRGGVSPDTGGLGGKISMSSDRYVVVEAGSLTPVNIPTAPAARMTKATAKRALSRYRSRNPTHARSLRIVPVSKTPMESIR